MDGYKAFYKNKEYDVYARSSYEAQCIVVKKYHIKDKCNITIVLCERNGKPVRHIPR